MLVKERCDACGAILRDPNDVLEIAEILADDPDEPLTEVVMRHLILAAMRRWGFQKAAARGLRISSREINYRLQRMGMRPKDRKGANAET